MEILVFFYEGKIVFLWSLDGRKHKLNIDYCNVNVEEFYFFSKDNIFMKFFSNKIEHEH